MKYFAFLRALNVGGHTVKMNVLKKIFESMGFSNVSTFIASGNVLIETTAKDEIDLENRIEDHLKKALGFEVTTFLRSEEELQSIANYVPFNQAALKSVVSVQVVFLKILLKAADGEKVLALQTPTDEFIVHGREVYWLVRTLQHESSFSNAVFEKTLGIKSTIRGIETIKKMVALENKNNA
jgi:uncharacterized protein (DUF1697 family)